MKLAGRGHGKAVEVVQGATLTPADVGILAPGDKVRSLIAVQTNFGTRHPKAVTGLLVSAPYIALAFIAPNILELTMQTPPAPVDEAFTFECDVT